MTRWLRLGTVAARRVVVAVVGGTVVLIGAAMLVLPGPAVVVIPVGLAILGLEFAWARRWLRRLRDVASRVANGGDEGAPERGAGPDRPAGPGAGGC